MTLTSLYIESKHLCNIIGIYRYISDIFGSIPCYYLFSSMQLAPQRISMIHKNFSLNSCCQANGKETTHRLFKLCR